MGYQERMFRGHFQKYFNGKQDTFQNEHRVSSPLGKKGSEKKDTPKETRKLLCYKQKLLWCWGQHPLAVPEKMDRNAFFKDICMDEGGGNFLLRTKENASQ